MDQNYPGLNKFFPHQDSHILGINNLPFLNLSEYCIFDLEKMNDEICLGLAKHECNMLPTVSGQIPPDLHIGDIRDKFYESEYIFYRADNIILEKTKNLSANQRRKYLFFKNKIIQPWSFIFTLKSNKFNNKTQSTSSWENFVDLDFPYTKHCIEQLPLIQIGRVVIYASYPYNLVPPHRDMPISAHKDHHININPAGYRPIYVYDTIDKTKYYLNNDIRMYAFNVRDYHGVDAVSNFSYTIRVDGQYTQEFLNKFNFASDLI